MIVGGLLLLAALGAPPLYTRPATPEADLQELRAEIAAGQPQIEAWRGKLRLYLALGELQTIPELVELMAQTFPQAPDFQEARMIFLSTAGHDDEAIALGERILQDYPDYPSIRANLGRVYLTAKKRARGVNLLLSALEQGPIRVEDWGILLEGLGLFASGRGKDIEASHEEMVTKLRQKIAENPQKENLRYVLLVVLTRLGRYTEARELVEQNPQWKENPDLLTFVDHVAAATGGTH